MKGFFARTAAALLAAVLFLPVQAEAISARRAIVVDATSGRPVFRKCPEERGLIASTTKIMTALLICEQCNVLDRMRIPREAVGIEGSSMYLKEGEVLTLQELLYGLMLASGNDAAVALAIFCSGTVEGFVEQMNDKAHMLGMKNTHFANSNGLDSPDHYSSAEDLARLAVYAMENPVFAKTVSTKSISVGQRFLRNHNKLLWHFEGADGVKTGYTKAAGRILVSSAVRDGRRLIAVTMDAPNDWQDHKQLLEEGFSRYHLQRIVTAGDVVGNVSVFGGNGEQTAVLAKENFVYAVAGDEQPQLVLPGTGFVYAPVVEGADAGVAYVLINGKAVGKIPVVYGQTIEQKLPKKLPFWKRIWGGAACAATIAENIILPGGSIPQESGGNAVSRAGKR